MSDWTVSLEFEEGNSSKFWRARVDGKTLYVNYGRIGTTGQTQVKDFGDPAGATKEYEKLIREKRKKGYADAGSGGGGGSTGADADDEGDDDGDDAAPALRPMPAAAPAPKPAGGARFLLESGNRKVETTLYLDGKTVRMDSTETYASPDAAKKAYDRLKKTLAGEGYQEG